MATIFNETGAFAFLKSKLAEIGYGHIRSISDVDAILAHQKEKNKEQYIELMRYYKGAKGEERALDELKKLPSAYYILNDVYISFDTPIRIKQTKEIVSSVRIDHVVVGPTGVFFIETKNWSEQTIQNNEFFSPFQQIRRHGDAMFRFINNAARLHKFPMDPQRRKKKVQTRNILLMTDGTMFHKVQFVRICTLDNIIKYIRTTNPYLTKTEVRAIASWLKNRADRDRSHNPNYCSNCGLILDGEGDFCYKCGAKTS